MATEKKKVTAIEKASPASVVPITLKETLPICTTSEQQVLYLTLNTPAQFIKKRMGRGGRAYDYIETNYVIGRLNAIFNFDWNLETIWQEMDRKNKQVAVKVRLTVRFLDGKSIIKEAFGSSEIKMTKTGDMVDMADDLKAAQSDGLKKAASMLGVGWDVYAGLAHAAPEAIDVDEEDDFMAEPEKPQDKNKYQTITIQLASGRSVTVSKFEALGYFGKLKEALGEEAYYATLKLSGFNKANEIPPEKIPQMYKIMVDAFRSRRKVEKPNANHTL